MRTLKIVSEKGDITTETAEIQRITSSRTIVKHTTYESLFKISFTYQNSLCSIRKKKVVAIYIWSLKIAGILNRIDRICKC